MFSAIHLLPRDYDVVYVCNSANIPAVLLLWLAGKRVVLNVDGLEWKRAKWSRIGQAYYRACAWAAARVPVHVVSDARVIQTYYAKAYGRATEYFPYGTAIERIEDDGTLASLGLDAGRYVLYVSRLEPENNAHVVIEAYSRVNTDLTLAIVGDAPYASTYIAGLQSSVDPRVKFTGAVYGRGYRILQSNAAVYVQATEVGGTHPALLEAMGHGNAIVANDVPEHRETLGAAGRYYRGSAELARELQSLIDDRSAAAALGAEAQERARELYSWDAIATSYESWFASLLARG
jgi:glycosyltransferase involved in cell wall biosynthesis